MKQTVVEIGLKIVKINEIYIGELTTLQNITKSPKYNKNKKFVLGLVMALIFW